MATVITIVEAVQSVAVARDEYLSAKAAEDAARRTATDRLNKLNEAEAQLCTAVEEFRKASPSGTDWRTTDFNTTRSNEG